MKTQTIWQKIHDTILIWVTILIVTASLIFPCILFCYNHWIGFGGRLIFVFVIITGYVFINKLLGQLVDSKNYRNIDRYRHLGKFIMVSIILFAIAGLTIYLPWRSAWLEPNMTIYNVQSGQLTIYDGRVRWHNPFQRTTVLMNGLQDKYECESFVLNRPLTIYLEKVNLKTGVKASILLDSGIIGFGNFLYQQQVTKSIERAKEKALLKTIIDNKNQNLTDYQKFIFKSNFENEIRKNLPHYLDVGTIRVE